MPSALLLAAVQLLKMNAKLAAALPPPCFLLHLIARFKFHPESLGKQRIPPLQKLQQGLFFSVLILYGCYNFPMMFPRSWLPCRQVRWLEQVGQKFLLVSAMMLLAVCGPRHNYLVLGISLVSTSASLPRYILQSGSSCSLWASFSLWNPSLSTSSSFWKPSFSSPESLCVARVRLLTVGIPHYSISSRIQDVLLALDSGVINFPSSAIRA